jgi:hypothetical protein
MTRPSFVRFLLCCWRGVHVWMECECCGEVSCIDCRTVRKGEVDA